MKLADRSLKTYGGGAGIFVRKCRIMRSAETAAIAATRTRAIAPSSTALLIGWDDVKCRPIFEKVSQPVPISDEDDDEEDALPNKEIINSEWDGKPGRKKRKAYGSRKGESVVIETATFTMPSRRNTQKNVAKEWSVNIPSATNGFPYASPIVVDESICDALDSDRKQITTTSAQEKT